MLEKRWVIKQGAAPELVGKLAKELNIDITLANLLAQRGVHDFDAAKAFFRPQLSDLHDPFLMKDMDKAVERLDKAIAHNERIMVYGDYDVDGTTAVATMYSFLRTCTSNLCYFIPERYKDGYGIAYRGIDLAHDQDVKLIIALDCGIKAVEKIEYAKAKGIDFIICDHHLPGNTIPAAVAVLDPKRIDCQYPYKELSGCGVGFKLLQAYCQYKQLPFDRVSPLLDLVATSIASDIVPITGENRILAHYGLKQINSNPRKGLLSIIKRSGLHGHTITIDDIVFRIGPRINAAGRMESGVAAVDLLTATTTQVADEVGEMINDQNNDRKNIDRTITLEAVAQIEGSAQKLKQRTLVVFNPQWHKGVVGIVASRLIETFYRPTIVLTESNGQVTGSARSIPGFDLYQAIESCSDLLQNFGGHMYAAGLTMHPDNVPEFERRFEAYAQAHLDPALLIPQVEIDAELDFADITPKFYRILKQFEPFGPGNMSPVFAAKKAYGNGHTKIVGMEGEHLKTEFIQENAPYQSLPAIAFNQAQFCEHIQQGKAVDVCYSIMENNYRGATTLQIRVRDLKKAE